MSSRNENDQINQTEFVEQVPFLEKKPGHLLNLKDLKTNKSLRPFYALITVLFLIVALTLFSIFFKKTPQTEQNVVKKEENQVLDPLTERVYQLREDLKEHNPTKQLLPFPQVDLEFNID